MRTQLPGEFSAVRELIQLTLAINSVITSTSPAWLLVLALALCWKSLRLPLNLQSFLTLLWFPFSCFCGTQVWGVFNKPNSFACVNLC